MVGSYAMSLYGWKQLIKWSIEFSCVTDKEKDQLTIIFERQWQEFCIWVDREFGALADPRLAAGKDMPSQFRLET